MWSNFIGITFDKNKNFYINLTVHEYIKVINTDSDCWIFNNNLYDSQK